jgi:hypothetical protein
MKKRPDWIGDTERREAWEQYQKEDLERRQKRNREAREKNGGAKKKKFFEMKTPEELDTLRDELVAAYDHVSALVAETITPEALAEAKRMREERQEAIADLNDALVEVGEVFAQRFNGVMAEVPGYDEKGDEFWICFDGKHLLWFEPQHGMKTWAPVRTCPMRIKTSVPDALSPLMSILNARRWMTAQPA